MKIKNAKFSMHKIDSRYLKYVSEFVERFMLTRIKREHIILLVNKRNGERNGE